MLGIYWLTIAERPPLFSPPILSNISDPDGKCHFTLGDFNQDSYLDIFMSGIRRNKLWENDGKGDFRDVIQWAGSLSYRAPPGVSDCRATDLNNDGRPDLCLLYPEGDFMYHFNRGFRCFGEEGALRLNDMETEENMAVGQKACAIGDFNRDGYLDLAVAFCSGEVRCYYSDPVNHAR